jgi:hypothetical protein
LRAGKKTSGKKSKLQSTLDQVVVCGECARFITRRDAYLQCPVTGRVTTKPRCSDCYERGVARAALNRGKPPNILERVG